MKTIKIILAVLTLTFMVSCGEYYRMVTTINANGNVYRALYASGDSAFRAGNISHNPFLFELGSDWTVNRCDTSLKYDFFGEEAKFNVKISKKSNSIESYSKDIRCDTDKRSLAAPEESLMKRTGWFYTNYSLKVTYRKLQYEVPISIDDFLTKEEQILWTQGGFDNYMNGFEMSDNLNNISDKFIKWYARNYFEISLEGIKKLTENYDLDRDKENIYKNLTDVVKVHPDDINPESVCNVLDSFYTTAYFSKLYQANHEILDNDYKQTLSITNVILNGISYELVLPGKVLQTNAPIIRSDTLVWKVDGMRLLFDDYTLKAEYRVINKWGFLLTGLLLVISIGSIVGLICAHCSCNAHMCKPCNIKLKA